MKKNFINCAIFCGANKTVLEPVKKGFWVLLIEKNYQKKRKLILLVEISVKKKSEWLGDHKYN